MILTNVKVSKCGSIKDVLCLPDVVVLYITSFLYYVLKCIIALWRLIHLIIEYLDVFELPSPNPQQRERDSLDVL